jgi:hypothetical protein
MDPAEDMDFTQRGELKVTSAHIHRYYFLVLAYTS